jgi:hypothetical protein
MFPDNRTPMFPGGNMIPAEEREERDTQVVSTVPPRAQRHEDGYGENGQRPASVVRRRWCALTWLTKASSTIRRDGSSPPAYTAVMMGTPW